MQRSHQGVRCQCAACCLHVHRMQRSKQYRTSSSASKCCQLAADCSSLFRLHASLSAPQYDMPVTTARALLVQMVSERLLSRFRSICQFWILFRGPHGDPRGSPDIDLNLHFGCPGAPKGTRVHTVKIYGILVFPLYCPSPYFPLRARCGVAADITLVQKQCCNSTHRRKIDKHNKWNPGAYAHAYSWKVSLRGL